MIGAPGVAKSMLGFPRRRAAASLKPAGATAITVTDAAFSAAKSRGLIEAARGRAF